MARPEIVAPGADNAVICDAKSLWIVPELWKTPRTWRDHENVCSNGWTAPGNRSCNCSCKINSLVFPLQVLLLQAFVRRENHLRPNQIWLECDLP